jgi:hypothetical protein
VRASSDVFRRSAPPITREEIRGLLLLLMSIDATVARLARRREIETRSTSVCKSAFGSPTSVKRGVAPVFAG